MRTPEESVIVPAPLPQVFAWLDDPANTGMHLNRPSTAMLGGTLRVERLSATTTGLGTTYRSWGRVLGLPIDFTTDRDGMGAAPGQEVADDRSATFHRPWGIRDVLRP